jgi:GntR family transcriptional regulator/MocR family aminotransferase
MEDDERDKTAGTIPEREETDGGRHGPGREKILYDFSPNGIEMSAFPFNIWKKITGHILQEAGNDLYLLGDSQGDYELRETISRYLHSSRGVNCTPQQVVIGAGNDYLLLLLQKLLGAGCRVAMENPTYKRAWKVFKSCGCDIVSVDMDESGMRADLLEQSGAGVAYCMPSHQYPTGVVMPVGRRAELLAWTRQGRERYLIEDDYDSEFRYRGKPIPSLQSIDAQGRVIYIGTFSKAIAPAIRVSFMVLPPELLERYRKEYSFFSSTVSRIDQRILNEFMKEGYFERHLNKMRKIYGLKHETLLRELEDFAGSFVISGENAGLHILMEARNGRKEEELIAQAAAQGVRVYGLSDSLIGIGADENQRKKATVLIGFGALQEEQIKEGIGMLKRAWL